MAQGSNTKKVNDRFDEAVGGFTRYGECVSVWSFVTTPPLSRWHRRHIAVLPVGTTARWRLRRGVSNDVVGVLASDKIPSECMYVTLEGIRPDIRGLR